MPTVDFTLEELLAATGKQTSGIVRLEVLESEGRIKTEIQGYVDVKNQELKNEVIDGVGELLTTGLNEVHKRVDRIAKAAAEK